MKNTLTGAKKEMVAKGFYKILHIEDNIGDFALVEAYLSDDAFTNYDLSHQTTLQNGLTFLTKNEVDVVLLDLGLPDSVGLGGVAKIIATQPLVTLVVLTGNEDSNLGMQAVEMGAQDYLAKNDLNSEHLIKSIKFAFQRRNAEKEIQKNKQQLEKLLTAVEESANTIVITDPNGKIEYVNKKFTFLTGYTKEEVIGANPKVLKSGVHDQKFYESMWGKIQGGETWQGQLVNKKKSGELYWESATITPITNETGEIVNFIAVKEDITKRVQAEQMLRGSEERFRQISELAGDLIWELDSKGICTFISPSISGLLGYTVEEVVGENAVFELFLPNKHKEQKMLLLQYIAEAKVQHKMNKVFRHKNGQEVWVKTSCAAFFDSDGNVKGYRGVDSDFTSLVKEKDRLKDIIASAPNAIYIFDEIGQIIVTNHLANKYAGIKKDNTYQENILTYVDPEDSQWNLQKIFDDLENRLPVAFESNHKRKEGGFFPIGVRISSFFYNNKRHAIAFVIDISEQMELTQKLKDATAKYANLLKNVPGMVYQCQLNKGLSVTFASEGCELATGYVREDFEKDPDLLGKIIMEEDLDLVWEQMNEAKNQQESFSMIFRIKDATQKIRWLQNKGQIFDGSFIEGILYDITDRVNAQDLVLSAVLETETNERSRIASEIHDGLQQTLTSSFLHLEAMRKNILALDNNGLQEKYHHAYNILQKGIEETREISHRLLPKVVEEYGIIESIEALVKMVKHDSMKIDFFHNLKEDNLLPKNIEVVIYRIIQEGVNNTIKYAKATNLSIQLFHYANQIVLTLEDNGKGFNIKKVENANKGIGILGMRSRAAAVGGFLQIDSKYGEGTNLLLTIPL